MPGTTEDGGGGRQLHDLADVPGPRRPAQTLLGIFVAWQIFPYFVSPFFEALLRVVHPTDDYF